MWNWLKRRSREPGDEIMTLAKQMLGPPSLAVALAETVRAYVDAVKAGKIAYPAHRREGASVVEIWADLRLEALHNLFNFGRSDPFILSDQRRQLELLTSFLDEQPHLEMPQPRGSIIPDTIQAMWQVYVYLDEAGPEVADRETDRAGLKLASRSILDHITSESAKLRAQWETFQSAPSSNVPRTLIEALYEDVTAKSKSIALSKVFGPFYESGIKHVEGLLAKRGEDAANFRVDIERIMVAKDPDHLMPES